MHRECERKWQTQFNADKCEVLRITKKKNPTISNYSLHDQHLQAVQQAKYLGATISSDLSWNKHVDNTVKKATNSLNWLRRNIPDCPPLVKKQCYKTLVRLTMEHASCVWDPYTNTCTNIKKLEMVQRRATHLVKGEQRYCNARRTWLGHALRTETTSQGYNVLSNCVWPALRSIYAILDPHPCQYYKR